MHAEKAPGPDGFIGAFFSACWGIIKVDLIEAFNQLHALRGAHWDLLNSANLVLLPKKEGASCASDFRPVSLMHSAAKILCKMLAMRLAPEMKFLVSQSQSAFIKGRSIQDNFLFVQNAVQDSFRKKCLLVFLKLDIAKAFDSVQWGFLLDLMKWMGFGQRWRNLIAISLASSTSRVLLNGIPGTAFAHRRGLRQGDPLSPLLFILDMDPLQKLLEKATVDGVLSPLRHVAARMRVSLYADDAAPFVNPVRDDFIAIREILKCFGDASGLRVSLSKCSATPTRCQDIDLNHTLEPFGGEMGTLPCKYVGLPLNVRNQGEWRFSRCRI